MHFNVWAQHLMSPGKAPSMLQYPREGFRMALVDESLEW